MSLFFIFQVVYIYIYIDIIYIIMDHVHHVECWFIPALSLSIYIYISAPGLVDGFASGIEAPGQHLNAAAHAAAVSWFFLAVLADG